MSKPFGQFVRGKRVDAHLSLRTVADRLGVSHVYLGEVERGVTNPLKKERWPDWVRIIRDGAAMNGVAVDVSEEDLARRVAQVRPLQMDLTDAPKSYQELGLALARRIEKRDLPNDSLQEILKILKGGGKR